MGGVIDRRIANSCKASLTRTVLSRSIMLLGRWSYVPVPHEAMISTLRLSDQQLQSPKERETTVPAPYLACGLRLSSNGPSSAPAVAQRG